MEDASGPTREHKHERPALRVFLLGGFRVEQGGREPPAAAWGHRGSARALVKLLALAPGQRLHREQLVDTLWPDADPDSARNSFAKALHAARHALEPTLPHRGSSAYLRLTDDMLGLDPHHTWVDVDHFERLTRAALPAGDVAAFEHAIDAYGGELLPEDRYAAWAMARRETLAAYYLQALLGLAGLHERRGDDNAALERLRQALQQDPAREETHRALMRLYARGGDRRQALRQYELCRVALREELAVEPDVATERLHRDILASARAAQADANQERAVEPDAAAPLPLPPPLRRAPSTPLVGRERVLEILREGLVNATAGRGGVTLVGGEAGVGKTRLVMEAAREAYRGGALILWGASYEREGVMPYGPFVEALEDYARGRTPEERAALAAAYPELGHLLPSLARESAPAATPGGGEGERAQLFAAIARLLDDLATPRPLVLALDDLHAADVASLQLLHYLARAASERRWLIVGTYRDEDVAAASPWGQLCATLMRDELCRRVDLRHLAHPDCDAFVRALLPGGVEPALLERLYALSLGNPLFVQELVRLLREQGLLTLVDGSWQAPSGDVGAPRGVRDLVEARVQGLGDDVRRTLTLAAVIGMDCAFALLSTAGDLAEEPLLDALDRALEARILDEREDGYAFRHPLFRTALYERLSRTRRARLHGTVARAMEAQRPDDVEALAYHCTQSGDTERASAYLELAGDRARAVYANETAATRYGEAADRLDGQGRASAAAGVREKLGAVLTTMARYDKALEALGRAALAYEAADDRGEGLARALARIGHAYAFRGLPLEGIARVQPALAGLEGHASPAALAPLYVTLALLSFTHGAYTEQLAAATRASDLARQAGDDSLRAEAEGSRGIALLSLGDPENACRVFEDDAIPLAERAGAAFALTSALHSVACIYRDWGELARSNAYETRALELAERRGDPVSVVFFLFSRGYSDFYRGDWMGARAHLRRAEAVGRATPSWCAPYPLMGLGQLSLAEGAWEAATGYLEESLIPAEAAGDVQALRYAQSLLAERDLLDGRPEAVITRLSPLLDRPGLEEVSVTEILPLLAWARLELGDHDAAWEIVQQSVARARARRYRLILVDALRVQGLVALRQKWWLEAARALDEALSIAESIPYPYGRARALHIYGLLHVEIGEPEPARERLEEALAILQRLGARRDSARVEQALSGLR